MNTQEIRVYGIDIEEYQGDYNDNYFKELSNEEFINIAEGQGLVHSIKGFEDQFNRGGIYSGTLIIRFI